MKEIPYRVAFSKPASELPVKIKDIIGGFALIQSNPADLHSRLEGVAAVNPSQVVDHSVGRAHFVICIDIVDRRPSWPSGRE